LRWRQKTVDEESINGSSLIPQNRVSRFLRNSDSNLAGLKNGQSEKNALSVTAKIDCQGESEAHFSDRKGG